MLIKPNAEFFRGLNTQWKPTIFSPSMLTAASSDAALWAQATSQYVDFDIGAVNASDAWARTQQVAFFRQGTGSLGIPSGVINGVIDSMAPLAISPPKNIEDLAEQLTGSVIGVVTNALSAVPVVGPIANMIGAVVLTIMNLRSKPKEEVQEFFSPLTQYNPDAEELMMNNTLPLLSGSDWTPLFLPRLGNDVRIERRDGGMCPAWVMLSSERSKHAGFIPGSQQIAGPIQAYVVRQANPHGDFCTKYTDHRDIGDFYPAAAQLLTAVSEQVQRPTAALWSVRPDVILEGWREHFESIVESAGEWWAGDRLAGAGMGGASTDLRQKVVQSFLAPYFVYESQPGVFTRGLFSSNWTPGREHQMRSFVDELVQPWCETIARRQEHYLGTTVVAYADPASAAFSDPALRTKMEEMRRLLLESPARREVDLDDVIDPEYRTALFKATSGSTLVNPAAPAGEGLPTRVDGVDRGEPTEPTEPNGGVPFHRELQRLGHLRRSRATKRSDFNTGKAVAVGLAATAAILALRGRHKKSKRPTH